MSARQPLRVLSHHMLSRTAITSWKKIGLFILVASIWLGIDLLTKQWALTSLNDGPKRILGPLWLRLARNSGSAFGLGSNYGAWIGFAAFAALAATLTVIRQFQTKVGIFFTGLMLGGALGNLTDRVFRADNGFLSGKVIDFIDLTWWPIFNVADIGIVVGLFGMATIVMINHSAVSEPEADNTEKSSETK